MLPRKLKTAAGAFIIVMFAYGGPLYGLLTASSRLSPDLSREAPVVDVLVSLNLQPEPFHLRKIRQYGIFAGMTDDNKLILYRVTQDEVGELSRIYWVREIEPVKR